MKTFIAAALAATLFVSSAFAGAGSHSAGNPDYNGDGIVDESDLSAFVLAWSAAVNAPPTATDTPVPTETATPEPSATVTETPIPSATATATPVPTATPSATPTVVPSATHDHSAMLDACGNDARFWHAACLHEHGDAPPAWLTAAGYVPQFNHNHGTGAAENSAKHAFMKGVNLVDARGPFPIQAYAVLHGSGVAQERVGRFHSAQLWVRDSAGGISYASWWNDYGEPCIWRVGDPENGCGRMRSFADFDGRPANQGAIRIIDGQGLEQWYPTPHGLGPDVPMLFSVGERFTPSEVYTPGAATAPALQPGQFVAANLVQLSTTRRFYEVLWHQGRFNEIPTGTPVLMSQFGEPVTAAQCANTAATVSYDGKAYRLQCAPWFITAQLRADVQTRPLQFGTRTLRLDNTNTQFFNTAGVVQPN